MTYDHCLVQEICHLSPPKKKKSFLKILCSLLEKVFVDFFKDAEIKSRVYLLLTCVDPWVLTIFLLTHMTFLAGFTVRRSVFE